MHNASHCERWLWIKQSAPLQALLALFLLNIDGWYEPRTRLLNAHGLCTLDAMKCLPEISPCCMAVPNCLCGIEWCLHRRDFSAAIILMLDFCYKNAEMFIFKIEVPISVNVNILIKIFKRIAYNALPLSPVASVVWSTCPCVALVDQINQIWDKSPIFAPSCRA